jgi:hypothetical protein
MTIGRRCFVATDCRFEGRQEGNSVVGHL